MKKNVFIISAIHLLLFCCLNAQCQTMGTICGTGTAGYNGSNILADIAELNGPSCIAADDMGNIYIVDYGNNCIRKINASGIITTIAGNTTEGYSGDGGPATAAEFNQPGSVCVDDTGNLLIADIFNNCIRKINTSGTITTIIGNVTGGFSGDGGMADTAQLFHPTWVVTDHVGNIYIADAGNNRIRMVNASGIIQTIAGNGAMSFGGDGGPATAAALNSPQNIALDNTGNIYVSDVFNNRVRKINTSGTITTFAGKGTSGYSGDGGMADTAELTEPSGLAVDSDNNIYVADYGNNRIRKISATGIISTCAGKGISGFSGDGGPANSAELNAVQAQVVTSDGSMYIADYGNNRIRKVSGSPPGINTPVSAGQVSVFPNPVTGNLNIRTVDAGTFFLYSVDGKISGAFKLNKGENLIDLSTGLDPGIYIGRYSSENGYTQYVKLVYQP